MGKRRERLDRNEARRARANEAKSSFLANVSHELRTPLSGILIASEMLHDRAFAMPSEEKVREMAGKIHGSGRHLLALIDNLLDLSRSEAGKLEVRPQPTAVGPLIAEVSGVIAPIAAKKGIALETPKANGHRVLVDPIRFRQVLLNLLTNAVKFTDRGGRVRVEVKTTKATVSVSIHDTGIGIRRADMKRIFRPFEQGADRPVPGTGLGLTISKRIIEAHKGRLTVESRPGQGSTFRVALPRSGGIEIAPATYPPGEGSTTPQGDAAPARILLVDDDAATLDLVGRVLTGVGHEVDTAETVDQALASVRSKRPALVLLDVRLGNENGLDVVRALRADPETRNLPVVAMSAHAMPQDIANGLAAGCTDYLVKPVGGKDLLQRMPSYLAAADPSPAAVRGATTGS